MNPSSASREIRATHPYAFRSGEWAVLFGEVAYNGRRCYHVAFETPRNNIRGEVLLDEDFWPVDDQTHGYEFREGSP